MKNGTKTIIVFLVLFLSAGALFAHEECEKMCKDNNCVPVMQNSPKKMMHGENNDCMACMKMDKIIKNAKEIGLSEEQMAKISDLESNCKKDMIKTQSETEILKVDKQVLLKKDEVDLAAVKDKIQKISALESEIEYNCIEYSIKIKKVLTDEQMKKLHDLIKTGKNNGKKHEKQEKQEKHEHDSK